ncbi:MAG TPA: site-2 protease family protein [Gemmatimonadales bacterium]|nr:site-2 protease family protein [Gemmatimonadales bacterium]
MNELTPLLDAWRIMRLGTREVVDGLVVPQHRGPSPDLAGVLQRWPGRWYWADDRHHRLVLIRALPGARGPRWLLHALLLVVTIVCSLGAGAALAGLWYPFSPPGFLGAFAGAGQFFVGVVKGDWRAMLEGWTFAVPLLGILLVHESGHYFAARRYEIDVTPPFFLPIPPTLSPIGSLGAFIRLRSPLLDRRQLLDVGAAGPIAGFVVAVAVLFWGYHTSSVAPAGTPASWVSFAGQSIGLGDSLLTHWFRERAFPGAASVHLSLPAFAGWVGVFITGLNLLPLSQLDGGHVLYGLLGRHQRLVALGTVIGLLALAQRSPSWYVWIVMTFLIGGGRWTHPSVLIPERRVPSSRRWVGLCCVVIFVLTFVPVPFGS